MRKEIFINEASFFISLPAIIIIAVASLVSLYFSMDKIAYILIFINLVAIMAYSYNRITLKKLKVTLSFNNNIVMQGETATLKCSIKNTGILPAVNSKIRIPIAKNSAIDASFCEGYRELSNEEVSKSRLYGKSIVAVLECEIGLLKKGETAECSFKIKALRRGKIRFNDTIVYCSDIIGLSNEGRLLDLDTVLFICPRIVPVDTRRFTHNIEFYNRGIKNYIDDVTLIKRNRNYEVFDEAKSINWNIFAATQKLMVNVYEKAVVKDIHIILDSESFNAKYIDKKVFENVLSVIFSIIVKLNAGGMKCGVSLPVQDNKGAVNIFYRNEKDLVLIVEELAQVTLKKLEKEEPAKNIIFQEHSSLSATIIKAREDKEKREGVQKSRSEFKSGELIKNSGAIGHYFYFTYDALKAKDNALIKQLTEKEMLSFVSYEKTDANYKNNSEKVINLFSIMEGA